MRVFSVPSWSMTAPWNFSAPPRPFRIWKYCTESEPCPTAWIDFMRCWPGRRRRLWWYQLVGPGHDSIMRNGLPGLSERM